jgi:hypothetical protein
MAITIGYGVSMDSAAKAIYSLSAVGFIMICIILYGIYLNMRNNKSNYIDRLANYYCIVDFFAKYEFSREYVD